MPPFRISFTSKKPVNGVAETSTDENARPGANNFYKPSLALGIKERRDEPDEFKLSSVTDNGEYMPPSPTEKKSYWHKSPSTTNSSNHRNVLNDNEPFSISRESFDSYRRSFDISGRSPIIHADSYTSRGSLDSRRSGLHPRSSLSTDTFARKPPLESDAEGFEDVKLQDESAVKPKKKGFLSRFGDTTDETGSNGDGKHHFSLLPGRKRGQSGTGSELEPVQKPSPKGRPDAAIR